MVQIHIKVGSLAVKEKVDFLGKKKNPERQRKTFSLTQRHNLCVCLSSPFFFLSSSLPS